MKTIITFILVFGILVIVHEFGHFFFAKRAGILVREFAIGMGPKIFSHQGKDGTTYTLRILPVGGYVRMAGAEEDDLELKPGMMLSLVVNEENKVVKINTSKKVQLPNSIPIELLEYDLEKELFIKGYENGDESQEVVYTVDHDANIIEPNGVEIRIAPEDVQFQSAKLSQRMLTNFAGPMNNFLLAIVLFTIWVFMNGGVTVTDTNRLGEVLPDGVASEAGLKENDEVLSIDGEKIADWQSLITIVQENPEKPLEFEVKRGNETQTIMVTPEEDSSGAGKIGIAVPKKDSLGDKLLGGLTETINNSTTIFQTLGSMFTNFNINKLGGPVMMFQLSSEASKSGVDTVIWLMAMLSVNLGIVNLLPIPALDGGKLVLNIFEGVRGKPLSQEKEMILTLIGVGFIMLLMILVTWNDIQRFFF
ncbi:RIP metalloprotease RseP [Enterococcus sp. BWB1-3]|uniref:RIP metalloprotease RseP n=1 Tax=unclassified Enterococcus TaxID=2608891 RepID=UPI0019220E73|nr:MULTISPECIES: RIP metalloprotease RseP [unclassified Enterococcus]MBL1228523.1 RIP metalloprotease RseP [Enterococcus sp. BWB1-3]MCB5950528.1 RIP metalloprotease RseP [Enterococcus sp. BWT-B8]